jgi:hypothetical protein
MLLDLAGKVNGGASGQGSVKVASGQVYALRTKRPLTRLSRDCEIAALSPRERAVLATATRARKDSPLPRAERVPRLPLDTAAPPLPISRREWQGIGSLPSPLGLSVSHIFGWTPGVELNQ